MLQKYDYIFNIKRIYHLICPQCIVVACLSSLDLCFIAQTYLFCAEKPLVSQ